MNENIEKPTMELPPLKRMCMTIGQLPSSYVESMSYYEMLVWFIHYLRDEVIPVVNANGEAVEELQGLYIQLQEYVNNYFDNLDVQEEINNKLDDMAESGQLTDIIAQYLGLAGMITFNNVAEMKAAQNLVNGSKCATLGFHSVNDGGSSLYKIRTITNDDVVDNMTIIELYDDTLIAELIADKEIKLSQLGAKGDNETDDTNAIKKAIDKFDIIDGENKTYIISDNITIKSNLEIKNCEFKGDNIINGLEGDTLSNIYIHDSTFRNLNYAFNLSCYWSKFENIKFFGVVECFHMINGTATGTLVENKYMNCDCQGVGSFISIPTGNKLTDAFIKNININCNDETKEAIKIDSGAGHIIDSIHIYGSPKIGISMSNLYNTTISNIYIENYVNSALYLHSQLNCNLNNIIVPAKTDKKAISLDRPTTIYSDDYLFNFNNLMIIGTSSITPTSIFSGGNSPKTQVTNMSCDPSYTINGFYVPANLKINKYFIEKNNNEIFVDNKELQIEKRVQVTGNEKTITIPLTIPAYQQHYLHAKFVYTTWLSGTSLHSIDSDILISRVDNSTTTITKTNADMPIVTTYDASTSTVTIVYTPSANSQYGNLIINY